MEYTANGIQTLTKFGEEEEQKNRLLNTLNQLSLQKEPQNAELMSSLC